MKMDLRGYFMNINRSRLLEICRSTLFRMRYHRVGSGCREVWDDVLDFDFVDYLTETIVLLDPVKPWRRYVSSQCLSRMKRHIADLEISVRGMPSDAAALRVRNSLCSFLGVLSHYRSYNLRRSLFIDGPLVAFARKYGSYSADLLKFIARKH